MEKAIDAGVHIILNPSPMDQQVLDCPIKQVAYIILNEIEAAEICGLVRKIKDSLRESLLNHFRIQRSF